MSNPKMRRPAVKFYLDLHSPYAYLAFCYIRKSLIFKQCDIVYIPVQMIAFVKAGVSRAPWDSPNKVEYLKRDMARWTERMNIPWQPGWPANFPNTRTSDVQRAVTACTIECPNRVGEVLDALYHAFWAEKKGVQLPEVYEPILQEVLGTDKAERVIQESTSEVVRTQLQKNTQEAIADGAPGMPWFSAINAAGEKDGFWGFDHLGLVARFLGLEQIPTPHL